MPPNNTYIIYIIKIIYIYLNAMHPPTLGELKAVVDISPLSLHTLLST